MALLLGVPALLALAAAPALASGGKAPGQGTPDALRIVPRDPLKLVVSLGGQTIKVYRGGQLIRSSRVSTGQPGHDTPAGIYSILQKKVWHRSNIYSQAPMPFMQRLTWSGIALHAGHVPDYPASHGCIRLPRDFAPELFSMTQRGVQVVIAKGDPAPEAIFHRALLNPQPLPSLTLPWPPAPPILEARLGRTRVVDPVSGAQIGREPPRAPSIALADMEAEFDHLRLYAKRSRAPLHILITRRNGAERLRDVQRLLGRLGYEPGEIDGYMGPDTARAVAAFQKDGGMRADGLVSEELIRALYARAGEGAPANGHLYVRQNFRPLFDAPVRIRRGEAPLGTHIFTAMDFPADARQARWLALSVTGTDHSGDGASSPDAAQALDRMDLPDPLRNRLERLLMPGSSLIISDSGLGPENISGTNFIVHAN